MVMFDNARTVLNGLSSEIATLAAEVRVLNGQIVGLTGQVRNTRIYMGEKLLALRALAHDLYGTKTGRLCGRIGADGKRAPNNWRQVCEQAGMSVTHAAEYMSLANPENAKRYAERKKTYRNSPGQAIARVNNGWPTWTPEQRDKFISIVTKLVRGE
jgi:hypothetical protein